MYGEERRRNSKMMKLREQVKIKAEDQKCVNRIRSKQRPYRAR